MKKVALLLLFIFILCSCQLKSTTNFGSKDNELYSIDTTKKIIEKKEDSLSAFWLDTKDVIYRTDNIKEKKMFILNDTGTTIDLSELSRSVLTFDVPNANRFKYDTVKAVLLVSDTGTYTIITDCRVPAITLEYKEYSNYTMQDKSNWRYGYVIIQSEYGLVPCEWEQCLHAAYHYGYKNKKPIGYLDSSKQPFSKDIIIWDYKIIE